MSELSASIKPDSEDLSGFGEHTNMLIPCCNLSDIQVIKKSDLCRRIPLLSVTYNHDP